MITLEDWTLKYQSLWACYFPKLGEVTLLYTLALKYDKNKNQK